MPAETEWIQTTTIRLPEEGQRVEFRTSSVGLAIGVFTDGAFVFECREFPPKMVHFWRPLPSPPKPTLPDFVEEVVFAGFSITLGITRTRERLASCFAWPHDPPQEGDVRLVPQTYHRMPCGSHQITNPLPE